MIIIQVISAMIYLYELEICYCDIKPSNILIKDDGMIKICDLNISKILIKYDTSLKTDELKECSGTKLYVSPEMY